MDHLPKVDHTVGHKANLNKSKITEIILSVSSDHNNNTKICGKSPNIWKLSNILLYNPRVKKKVSKKILKYFEPSENEYTSMKT